MDALIGFEDELKADDQETASSCRFKIVPWMTWDEWDFVRDSLFSSSPDSIARALDRISAWRSRGCLPVVIEVTASIIEIQQKDPYFRKDLQDESTDSDEILAMLYCMAIMRLVNCVVEKNRKKEEISIARAADEVHMPRMLIDIRHEGSHRDLPSLRLVRRGSIMALDWLKFYYWDPQKDAIPFQSGLSQTRKEIKSKLHELAFCIKMKQSPQSGSNAVKGKRSRPCDMLCGRRKFFSLAASKLQSSKTGGYKKHIKKTLNSLVQLYSSFSSEVASLLLEFLLSAPDPMENDWKVVITQFSSKEPELVLSLLNVVLDLIQTREAMKYGTGKESLSSEYQTEICEIERLSSLFRWLVGNLKGLKPLRSKDSASAAEIDVPKAILTQVMRKCLLVSAPGNIQLMDSALLLAAQIGNNSTVDKLKKLSKLYLSYLENNKEDSPSLSSQNNFIKQEESISQAAKKLELVKSRRHKGKIAETTNNSDLGKNSNGWIVAESWNPCPLGMLPRDVGSSGRYPVLDHYDNAHRKESPRKQREEQNQVGTKRVADSDVQSIDNSSLKKVRETESIDEREAAGVSTEGIKGRLMIEGVWKEVGEKELLHIQSTVRMLV